MDKRYFMTEPGDLSNGKIPVRLLGDSGEVFYELALEMVGEIERNNAGDRRTVFIVPVGPVGQYPIFVRLVKERNLSLKDCWFINMDEYLVDETHCVPEDDKLSFHGFMEREVYSRIPAQLVMPPEQRVFPDPLHPEKVQALIEKLGGVDISFGGIGINGHLAFNEAEDVSAAQFAARETRVLKISRETRVANAIGDLNGAIDAMPEYAVTIGMRQILGARKLRLGVFRDWHRAVVRQAVFDEPSGHFPVTLAQGHPDAMIYVNANAAKRPF
ncbi:MAG: glucosamine-6-phosphate isomerase [Sphaerochaetaceae bacterium]|nr:glucosamine-6-phosphate isomerase [Sphaerochaetaceae bacterium]